ncbi:methyltransferase domain-containing protein [Pseudonocardia sp. GCM10023141]|uniref:methyltransferase domain-containing protein n=1 Tax=Pseudonocardia sp. GCM10023141 TaxID=3252653 RepID=UPI00360FBEB9
MASPDPAADPLLRSTDGRTGQNALEWSAAPLAAATCVLEVAGSGIVLERPSGRTPMQGSITALPLRTNAVDGVRLLLTLPGLAEVDRAFAELRRVLRPGATLVVLVPSASRRTAAELRMAGLLAGVHRGWTNRSALDNAGWLLAAADFAVLADDRRPFTLPLPDAAAAHDLAAALPRAGLWPADIAADVPARLAARAAPGRVLPVPMRRLIARR